MYVCETATNAASTIKSANFVLLFALNKAMSSQVDRKTFGEHHLHTDPSDDRSGSTGHRGTGGGGGEQQGGIVGEGEENIRRETLCTSAGRGMRWAGRCMYVCEYVHTIRCMGCGMCISLSAASLTYLA